VPESSVARPNKVGLQYRCLHSVTAFTTLWRNSKSCRKAAPHPSCRSGPMVSFGPLQPSGSLAAEVRFGVSAGRCPVASLRKVGSWARPKVICDDPSILEGQDRISAVEDAVVVGDKERRHPARRLDPLQGFCQTNSNQSPLPHPQLSVRQREGRATRRERRRGSASRRCGLGGGAPSESGCRPWHEPTRTSATFACAGTAISPTLVVGMPSARYRLGC
jgi:hypothetical protein